MATMKVEGLDHFAKQLNALDKDISKINRGALGEGAKYAANQIEKAIDSMPTHSEGYSYAAPDTKRTGATASEKSQIKANFGIARFKKTGSGWDTSIGFHGYVHTPSKRFNDNVPTGMLVQCIDQGTDFRNGIHSISSASRSAKGGVESKIQDYIDKEVNKIMK